MYLIRRGLRRRRRENRTPLSRHQKHGCSQSEPCSCIGGIDKSSILERCYGRREPPRGPKTATGAHPLKLDLVQSNEGVPKTDFCGYVVRIQPSGVQTYHFCSGDVSILEKAPPKLRGWVCPPSSSLRGLAVGGSAGVELDGVNTCRSDAFAGSEGWPRVRSDGS